MGCNPMRNENAQVFRHDSLKSLSRNAGIFGERMPRRSAIRRLQSPKSCPLSCIYANWRSELARSTSFRVILSDSTELVEVLSKDEPVERASRLLYRSPDGVLVYERGARFIA